MSDYAVIVERTRRGFVALVPDLPGCIIVGRTEREIEARIFAAVQTHLKGLRQERAAVPKPVTRIYFVPDPKSGPLERVTDDVGRLLTKAVRVAAKTGVATTLAVGQRRPRR